MTSAHIRQSIEGAIDYLSAHPEEARYTDSPATAVIDGLKSTVHGVNGEVIVTDMPTSVGGGDSAPSPGWLLRAAMASCVATLIAMRAAQDGIELSNLEVAVESESDDRGILGMEGEVPAGPLSARVRVSIAADGVTDEKLREVVSWAYRHCPVTDAVERAILTEVEIQVA